MLLIGDFNIPTVTSAAYRTLAARIVVPSARAGVFGTDLAQGKRYDQILVVPHPEASAHARFTGAGRALDFLRGVAPGAISAAEHDGIYVRDERPLAAVGGMRCA